MNNKLKGKWISVDVQASIEPTPTLPYNKEKQDTDLINIKSCRNPTSKTLETYELKMPIFK